MLSLSIGTILFQLTWGMSWAAVAFGLFFYFSKLSDFYKAYGWKLTLLGLMVGAANVYFTWSTQGLEHSASQDRARGGLFMIGFFALGVPCLLLAINEVCRIRRADRVVLNNRLTQRRNLEQAEKDKREKFLRGLTDWPTQACCIFDGRQGYILINSIADELRLLSLTLNGDLEIAHDRNIPIDRIFSVTTERPQVIEEFYRTEHVPVVSSKNKSPVGRAILGYGLLGPLGAIMGGLSGSKTEISTVIQKQKIKDQRLIHGAPIIVIGVKDVKSPVVRLKFRSESLAEEWQFRLKGLIPSS